MRTSASQLILRVLQILTAPGKVEPEIVTHGHGEADA